MTKPELWGDRNVDGNTVNGRRGSNYDITSEKGQVEEITTEGEICLYYDSNVKKMQNLTNITATMVRKR